MIAKEDFKECINNYIVDKKDDLNFVNNFVENLYILLYDKKLDRRTQEKRKHLQEALQEENLGMELRTALPQLSSFFDWIDNEDFIKQQANIHKHYAQKNLLETFEVTQLVNNPAKFQAIAHQTRQAFKNKIQEYLSPQEYIYFLKYTELQSTINEEKKHLIRIRVPQSPEEKSKGKEYEPYMIKKFDDQLMPLFDKLLRQATSMPQRFWIYDYSFSEASKYDRRKDEIGQKKYVKFLQYERNGSDEVPQQGDLFAAQTVAKESEKSALLYKHSGNEGAHRLLSQRLQSQRDVQNESGAGVVLRGNNSEKDQKLLIEYYIFQLKKKLPFCKVGIIDCDKFSKKCRAVFTGEDKPETPETKRARVDKWLATLPVANVFVLYNIDELNNKSYSTKQLLKKINELGHSRLLITSNKKITDFHEAKIVGSKEDKKGFAPGLMKRIRSLPMIIVKQPLETESGKFLYEMFKNKHPSIKIGQNLLYGIGKLLPDPGCYDALIEEIMVACQQGKKPFTPEMARNIIHNRVETIYNPSMDEIAYTVKKYFKEIPNDFNRSHAQIEKEILKHTAYRAMKSPLPGSDNMYRSYEEIGRYLKVIPGTAKRYINEITNDSYHKKELGEKIQEMKSTREKIILGYV